ncbi:hypothetical protein [Lysobacter sp. A3-1-A15]|uniref:hypothetical protein n=1 Tax=Novilysobacter viscosus TaxID=3098602 RepID=UPI002ED9DB0A
MSGDAARNAYGLRFTLERRHLHVRVVGHKDDLATTVACWRDFAAEVRRTGAVTLLVEDDLQGPPLAPEDMPAFMEAMKGEGLAEVRIAYVEAIAQRIGQVEVGEILARELGFVARVFASRMDAEMWLRHGER